MVNFHVHGDFSKIQKKQVLRIVHTFCGSLFHGFTPIETTMQVK
jgi:hypothetical protein